MSLILGLCDRLPLRSGIMPNTYEVAVVNRKEAPDKITLSGRKIRRIQCTYVIEKTFLIICYN